jgi:hypothetical protein
VRKIDQAQDPEHHCQSDGHERIEAADADRIDRLLNEKLN